MPIKLHGKSYLTVTERLNMLHKEHKKDYSLETLATIDNGQYILIKAVLTIGNKVYTGHGLGDLKSGPKICESTETHAIGRCLAAYGLFGDEFASANEIQDYNKQISTQEVPDEAQSTGATQKQLNFIKKLCNEQSLSYEDEIVGIDSVQQASEKIEDRKAANAELLSSS